MKEHHRILHYNPLATCKLNNHLADIEQQAEELFSQLVKQMAERKSAAKTLKVQEQIKENPLPTNDVFSFQKVFQKSENRCYAI